MNYVNSAALHGYLVDRVEQTTKAADNMTPDERAAEMAPRAPGVQELP